MDNEALNTEKTKDNALNETQEFQELEELVELEEPGDIDVSCEVEPTPMPEDVQIDHSPSSSDSWEYAPNDPFAPPKEHKTITGEMPYVPVVSAEDAANPEIGGDIEVERARERKPHPVLRAIAFLFVLLVIAAGAVCAWLVYDDSRNASCHVPDGVTLDGESVSGFSSDEVRTLVENHVRTERIGTTVLEANGQQYKLDSARLGDVNVEGTVDAVMATIEQDRVKRCVNRALGFIGKAPDAREVYLRTICAVDDAKVRERVASIAAETDVDAVDAGYMYDDQRKTLIMVSAKTGQAMNVDETTSVVLDAMGKGLTTVSAVVTTVEPKKFEAGYGIFVNRSRCFLYLYKNGKQVKTCACSPGPKDYPTPEGNWTIQAKDEAPVWTNPHAEWSAKMPETVAAGEGNPLGLRAMELSCGGVYICGTNAYKKLGKPRGHGDIAIGNDDVVELFKLVSVGTPVFVH